MAGLPDFTYSLASLAYGTSTIAADGAVSVTVERINATGANITRTLPDASTNQGRFFTIKKTDASAHTVIIACTGADTIDGAATVVLYAQYDSITVVSNGSGWDRIA